MCGIAGIVNLKPGEAAPSREALVRMAAALYHRGPDEFGIYRDRHAGFAHARLSILDLATGQQPLSNRNETLWIVFNGEIFNYIELRSELERLGHCFRTKSDTEVIVQAYEAWGEDAFARMNGQWAVALWDATRRRLVLSRDRLGVRPLYLCEHRGKLYFGSEVKSIFAAEASIPRALDPVGIDETFTFWTVVPPQTVFRGIEELRPGHVRAYENGRMRECAYWQPQYPEESKWIPGRVAVRRARNDGPWDRDRLRGQVRNDDPLSGAATRNDGLSEDCAKEDSSFRARDSVVQTTKKSSFRTGDAVARSGIPSLFEGSLDDAAGAVRDALEHATSLRMLRADVPVGSYLSGGLDSSLVAALGRRYAGDRFQTFSMRFDDAEYDETEYQRLMVKRLGSDHQEVVVSRSDIARVFPDVVYHTERPILRTAPAPLYLLSKLVHDHGIKVVLTGEGADEMFAGYDLFREGKVRRFWAQEPGSTFRPRMLERLYPYLARSPVAQQAMARQFFGRNLERHGSPGFAHDTRWHTTAALKRLFSTDMRESLAGVDATGAFLDTLPAEFAHWSPLAQDQYIEIRTLLSGYLLSSQGDRMLMSHSIEGRFPFLDKEVVALADSLPARYKLRGLDEKHLLKRAARGLVPDEIIARPKQPYRAPDALSFIGKDAPDYVEEMFSEKTVADAAIFEPKAIAQLWKKCKTRSGEAQFSNTDNMALVGVLSTQLLHHHYVRNRPEGNRAISLRIDVDRLKTG